MHSGKVLTATIKKFTMATMVDVGRSHGCHHQVLPSATKSQQDSTQFTFAMRSRFNASRDLMMTRSEGYILREPPRVDDIWKRPPPDFRLQQYLPKPPKRNSRESMQPWRYATHPEKAVAKPAVMASDVALPKILQPQRPPSSHMITRFRLDDPSEARMKSVKNGMHPRERYQMPKKHDFRGYPSLNQLGLSEFITASDHDPYNIQFKARNRDIIVGLPQPRSERSMGRQMNQPLTPKPRYQPELIMPNLKWPTTSGEFTRFRRTNRSPNTVLLEHIEGHLNDKWKQDREEGRQLQEAAERADREQQFRDEVARQLVARTEIVSASTAERIPSGRSDRQHRRESVTGSGGAQDEAYYHDRVYRHDSTDDTTDSYEMDRI